MTPQANAQWAERAKLLAPDGAAGDQFGVSVSCSGASALVGAWGDAVGGNPAQGSAYLYRFNGSAWNPSPKFLAPDGSAGDRFGRSVALENSLALIGAPNDDGQRGSAYLFQCAGTTPTFEARLVASDRAALDDFGISCSLSNDAALIGSYRTASPGAAYLFRKASGSWIEEAKLTASDGAAGDAFGLSVSVSGNLAVVGAGEASVGLNASQGAAYVYRFNGSAWTEEAKLTVSDGAAGDRFGSAVSASGNAILIGGYQVDGATGTAGRAYVFRFNGSSWFEEQRITPSDAATFAIDGEFGFSVSLSGNRAAVGAWQADPGGIFNQGSAYVFLYDGSFWPEVARLVASDGDSDDFFGHAISISGATVAVGAHLDDPGGNVFQGSAYIFSDGPLATASPTPTPTPTVCAPDQLMQTLDNPAPADAEYFGYSVAVDGALAVAGAPEDSPGGITLVGSAYVFNTTTGALAATLTNPAPTAYDGFGQSVSISGSLAVVGAFGDSAGGSAYIFNPTTGALLAPIPNPIPAAGDAFGYAVSISGNLAVVGAYGKAVRAGSAYVFNATTGALVATLSNPTPGDYDDFGHSVAISGNLAVVAAYRDDPGGVIDAGTAYVFNATTGALVATLYNPAPSDSDYFGWSVAISGELAVVGAFWDDPGALSAAGSAYVFNATTGALVATLSNPAAAAEDWLGFSVAISGNVVVAGAPRADSGADSAGVFYRFNATTGALLTTITNPIPAVDDEFGNALAISGNTVVAGARGDNGGTGFFRPGTAYVFGCAPSTPTPTPSPTVTGTPTPSPSATSSPSLTPTPSPTPSASPTGSPSPSMTPSGSPSPTPTASPSATATPTPNAGTDWQLYQ